MVKIKPEIKVSKKKFFVAGVTLFLVLSFLSGLAGCRPLSMAGYEKRMKQVLEDTQGKIEDFQKELGMAGTNREKMKKVQEEELKILEEVSDQVKRINPPDQFFVGHSDLVEFLELIVESKKLFLQVTESSTQGAAGGELRSKALEKMQAGLTSFKRATNELPFLQYELDKTFGYLTSSFYGQPFAPSGYPSNYPFSYSPRGPYPSYLQPGQPSYPFPQGSKTRPHLSTGTTP